MAPLVERTLFPVMSSCSGLITKSKCFNATLGSWMCIVNISFPSLFLRAIDGMTLFRPQDIITLESQTNFSLTRFSEIGVNFGVINSREVLIQLTGVYKLDLKLLLILQLD